MKTNKKVWLPIAVGISFLLLCIGLQILLQVFAEVEQNAAAIAASTGPVEDSGVAQTEQTARSTVKLFENQTVVCFEDRIVKRFQTDENQAETCARITDAVKAVLPADTKLYVLPVPEKILFEAGYTKDATDYLNYMKQLRTSLAGAGTLIDAYPSLAEHAEESLFFQTEDSWNMKGAYYGVLAFCEQAGIEAIPFEQYERMENVGHFKGSLTIRPELQHIDFVTWQDDELVYYHLPGSQNLAKIIEVQDGKTVEINKALITFSSRNTSSVLSGNYVRAIVPGDALSSAKKDEYLLLLCDGDGKLLLPYLKNYYKGVYVVNITHNSFLQEDISTLVQSYHVKDVLIAQDTLNFGKKGFDAAVSPLVDAIQEKMEEQEEAVHGNDIP